MKFFIDTANVEEIKKADEMGVICGVTTNPSLIAKEGRDFKQVIEQMTKHPLTDIGIAKFQADYKAVFGE